MASFDLHELSGTPHERGLQHGTELSPKISRNVDIYLNRFEKEGVDLEVAREQADEFFSLIESVNPQYATEMRGIAEGSDTSLTHIALLNARYEIIHSVWQEQTEETAEQDTFQTGRDGCTSFGVLPGITADNKTYIGQNWDWLPPTEETVVLTRVLRPDEPNHLVFTEAGIVGGKAGVNEHGVGLGLNGLTSSSDGESLFCKPIHVRCREVMNAERLDTAMEPILGTERPVSANFVLGAVDERFGDENLAGDGEIINLEAAPALVCHQSPSNGLVTHANHFTDDRIMSLTERRETSTLYRADRLRRHIESQRDMGGVTRQGVQDGLRDHFGQPSSICRHMDKTKSEDECVQTNASLIICLDDRTIYAVRGRPCNDEYRAYRLS